MNTGFSRQQWQNIKENHDLWWAGQLDRPLIQLVFTDGHPGRAKPDIPNYPFTSFYDLDVPAEAIVDRWDYDLSCHRFIGDAFPRVCPNFGPGVIAAFLGAELKNGDNTVWFSPPKNMDIANINFQYNEHNLWLDRIKDIYRAAVDHWAGSVLLSMTDLGGNLDILATFRPSEKLLLDLYDAPEQVKRLTSQAHECWFKYFQDIGRIIEPTNPGYSAWAGIYSCRPYYMLQCDFSYMIGPNMFDEFVKPELVQTCKQLGNSFYHLDGPGALAHLDSLLSIEDLGGIQWVPGAGQQPPSQWLDVFRKIRDAGKLLQLVNVDTLEMTFDLLDEVVEKLGSGKGLIAMITAPASAEDQVIKRLDRYNVT